MFLGKTGAVFQGKLGRNGGSAWEILAPAKLNLYLEVLGPRADGFHALETLMVPVRLYDQLSWHDYDPATDGDRLNLRICSLLSGNDQSNQVLGASSENLVLKAARLLADSAGVEPCGCFELIKRIPVQAGLGGGSSDAAAALLLVNHAWKVGYTRQQLLPLAAQLGSDVPFFLGRSAAVCRGRGELVEPVAGLPRLNFVIVKPPTGLSTAEVFGQLPADQNSDEASIASSQTRLSALIAALQCGAISSAGRQMTNRLEAAAAGIAPWLVSVRRAFSGLDCVGQFMTGSGSAYVGIARSAKQAGRIARQLASRNLGNVIATSNC